MPGRSVVPLDRKEISLGMEKMRSLGCQCIPVRVESEEETYSILLSCTVSPLNDPRMSRSEMFGTCDLWMNAGPAGHAESNDFE